MNIWSTFKNTFYPCLATVWITDRAVCASAVMTGSAVHGDALLPTHRSDESLREGLTVPVRLFLLARVLSVNVFRFCGHFPQRLVTTVEL